MIKYKYSIPLLFSLFMSLLPLRCAAEIVVIANLNSPIASLTRNELSRIYLGKMKFFPNGAKMIPVDQRVGSRARVIFYSEVLQKSETQIKSYWSRIIFTGQGYPPIQESDDRSVKELVARNPNTLGYIDRSFLDGSVKVLYTIR